MPVDQPTNGIAYWVEFHRYASKPFVAVWIAAAQEWEIDILLWRVPWYITPWFRLQ